MLVVTMDFPVDVESGSSRYFIGILKNGNHMYNQDQLRINLGNKPNCSILVSISLFLLALYCQRIVFRPRGSHIY